MVAPAYVTPDKFVVVSMVEPVSGKRQKLIVSGWYGGYLHGNSWRISRCITKETEHEDRWVMETRTGSVYELFKGRGGTNSMSADILESMRTAQDAESMGFRIEEQYK